MFGKSSRHTEPSHRAHRRVDRRARVVAWALASGCAIAQPPGEPPRGEAFEGSGGDESAGSTSGGPRRGGDTRGEAGGGATTASEHDDSSTGHAETDGDAGVGLDDGDEPTTTGDAAIEPPPHRFVDVTLEAGLADIVQVEHRVAPFCLLDRVYTEQPGDFCVGERLMSGATVGDLDGDGFPDLVLPAIDGGTRVLRNDGAGAFVDDTEYSGIDPTARTVAAAIGDIDRDGDLDVYLTSFADTRHWLYLGDGTGAFVEDGLARGAAVPSDALHLGTSTAMGDVDLDGDLDLFVAEWKPDRELGDATHHIALLRNLGPEQPGYFEDVTSAAGIDLPAIAPGVDAEAGVYAFAPAFVDLDRDGLLDLAIASDYSTSRLYWNRGDFTFEDGTVAAGVAQERNGMGSTFADFDGDGDLDWFVSAIYTEEFPTLGNRLYLYAGGRAFDAATDEFGLRDTGWAWGATAFDHDHDGDVALAVTAGWPTMGFDADPFTFWDDDGQRPWADVAPALGVAEVAQGRGLVDFDYDRDGDLDLLVLHYAAAPRLYRNDDPPGASLRVRARGTLGDIEGRGAAVELELADGRVLVQQLGVGAHLYGHGEPIAHFGLGPIDAPPPVALRVRWPVSGATAEILAPTPGSLVELIEPDQ